MQTEVSEFRQKKLLFIFENFFGKLNGWMNIVMNRDDDDDDDDAFHYYLVARKNLYFKEKVVSQYMYALHELVRTRASEKLPFRKSGQVDTCSSIQTLNNINYQSSSIFHLF